MPPPSPVPVTFRFTHELPIAVELHGHRWVIGLSYFPKGKAAIEVLCDRKRRGYFAGGRHSDVEHALGAGFEVPAGTVRHWLARVLVERRLGEFVERNDDFWHNG